ncbi:MAG: hypothetical protein AB1394_04475 [Bacteroidota bacterium]
MEIRTIDVSEITLGLELAEPVKNLQGQMLLSAGTTLAENHIRLFKIWGIQSVTVNYDEDQAQKETASSLDYETMAILKKRISWVPMNEYEAEIYSLAVQTISKQTKS